MDSSRNLKLIFITFCIFLYTIICASDNYISSDSSKLEISTEIVLHNFLYSKDTEQVENDFLKIINNENNYRNLIFTELKEYLEKPDSTPDALIYLAAYIKDKRYISILTSFIENPEYSFDRCIYTCPIIFALTVYSCFSSYSLPDTLNKDLVPVQDLISEINRVNKVTLKSEKASDYIQGPGIDSDLKLGESMTTEQLIILASPKNDGSISRLAAAIILEYRIDSDKYLPNLYWLAITGYRDASMEFLSSIHRAIYKAEIAKLKKASIR